MIPSYAFAYCDGLESVELPDSLESINSCAFYSCYSLKSIIIPEGITNLSSQQLFANCNTLESITLPGTLTVFGGNHMFDGTTNITDIYFNGSLSQWMSIHFGGYLPENAYNLYIDGKKLTDLTIPSDVTCIPAWSFTHVNLNSVTISNHVKEIGECAFYACYELESVTLPDTIETIGDSAFSCGLTYAEFKGDAPSSMGKYVFGPTNSINGVVVYYHSGTTGWSSPKWNDYYAACADAFSDYSTLDSDNRNAQGILFTLNDSAKTATVGNGSAESNNAGYYGTQKGAVVIPDTVTKDGAVYQVIAIGTNAFSGNKHVTSVSIGNGVTSIVPSAFMACPRLESFTVTKDNEYYSAEDGVLYDISGLYLYVYPGGKSNESFSVPDSVKTIGMYAFYDNEHLRTLSVGRSVTAIYRQAFCGLTNLSEITLPFIGSRERNADESYNYYSEQFSTVFGNGVYGINPLNGGQSYNSTTGRYEYNYGNLKRVYISGGTLYTNAFSNCGGIEELTFSFIPSMIPGWCFSGCAALQKLTFANHKCELGELILPEGIETIGASAFSGCKGITSVTLPASLTGFDSTAFSGAGLEKFIVAEENQNYSTDSWGVLYNYDKTTLVQYPSCRKWPYYNVVGSATSISSQAFSGCNNLVNLYIPNSVTSIGRNGSAVTNCPNLTVCCYMNSAAYRYALDNSLTAWYMDNKKLQGISIYSLPEQKVQVEGQVDLQGLYVVGNYQGKELQIDDYTLSYDQKTSGVKTVIVEYQGKTVTFEMVLYVSSEGNIISFHCDEELDGKMVMISVYDSNGKMLYTGEAIIVDGTAQVGVNDSVYQNADHAKLFILDQKTFGPTMDSQEQMIP